MGYKLQDLIDINMLQTLLDSFAEIVHIPIEICDLDGNHLVDSGSRRICREFHRCNPVSEKRCVESRDYIRERILEGEKSFIFKCRNGLINVAAPITVNDECLGILIQGQYIGGDTEIDYFKKQALKLGFNQDEYLNEVKVTPVFPDKGIEPNLKFLSQLGNLLAEMGYNQMKLKEKEKTIFNLAYFDALTELPNRTQFDSDLKKLIEESKKKNGKFGLMIIDIDNFKTINDTMGHGFGDKLLNKIGIRISRNMSKNCKLYRIGGDEFVILLKHVEKTSRVEKMAENILELSNEPFDINNKKIFSSISIGISIYPDECESENKLLENADVALYKSKTKGKNTYSLYDKKMHDEIAQRVILESELRHAVMNNEFVVFYQPQNDAVSGRIKGAEALVRWNHPSRGLIGTAEFISVSEDIGVIEDIGEFVLLNACRQGKKWNDTMENSIKISVNLSVKQLQKKNIVSRIREILEETGFNPNYLELEITESIAMEDFELTSKIIKKLKKMGIGISLDDFGSGYSSLNYLQKLDINTLKIDKTFIDQITSNSLKVSIVRSIIDMAHNLKLKVIAEGVESKKQLECLKVSGCDGVQGYLFSKPVPEENFTEMLVKYK